ncbi:MAG: hypothetical protein B7Z14_06790 [Bosea sp. 32-68-6]|nr:MAG: hypothetical protein B7Z14_06790 [Bosea sp. 32-68-6]
MARAPLPPTSAAAPVEPPVDPRKQAVEALMRLASTHPWDEIELGDIAAEAGLPLAKLRGLFPSKLAMLGGLTRLVDEAVLAETSDDLAAEPVRERLFDLVMRRLDALGTVRVQGAVLLMARVSEVWLEDDEPELSRTMARLDRELKTAGSVMARVEDVHRLTAPLRGLARALCSGRRPGVRRRERSDESLRRTGEDFAPAI